jgi:PAS domain S-box-containing protein
MSERETAATKQSAPGGRILVVEDDDNLREAVRDVLRGEGFLVTEAHHGQEALACLRGPGPLPDLVLLDLSMPVMDGWECFRAIRADASLASLPVVVMSGEPRETAPVPDSRFLRKPFGADELLAMVRSQRNADPLPERHRPTEDEEGCGRYCCRSDCPARRRREAATRQAQTELARLERIAQIGTWEIDIRTGREHWSEGFYRLVGLPSDTVPRFETLEPLIHPDDRPRYVNAVAAIRAGDVRVPSRFRFQRADGTVIHLRAHTEVRRDETGAIETIVATVQDVTQHEEAEAAIRESRLHFETLANSGRALFWTSEVDGSCNYFNRPWFDFTGRTLEQERGFGWAEGVHPDDRERCLATYTQAVSRREPFSMDYRLRHVSGEYRWVQDDGVPRYDSGGRFIGFIGHCLDITDRKKLQAALVQADRLSSMGMLAAGVAHELNNPLAYVLANLESLVEDLDRAAAPAGAHRSTGGGGPRPLDPSTIADFGERLREALEGAQRMRELVRGLGTFSRVEEGAVGPVDLRPAIESAISIATNEMKYRARLETDLRTVACVRGSEGRLSQVFLNLLINAAHAIPEGHVAHNRIRVSTWQEGDRVFAEVEDTGCGIPRNHLPHVFEPFFTTKPIGKGSGLGLVIVRNIVTGFGGTISVESEEGRGTRFRVEFPAASDAGDGVDAPASEPAPPGLRGRLLLIDDEPHVRAAIRRLLGDHEVVEADSGEGGKALLARDPAFDVILCDVMMPQTSGVDVHRWLLERDPEMAAKLVFLSGGAFTPEARAYLERSSNPRLQKPFDGGELRRRVAAWVEAARVTRAP